MTNRYFDPAVMHHWQEVSQRGEWPTVDIAPMCSPSERRTIHTSDVPADGPMPDANVCPDCATITALIEARR